jgi:HPt (histidine-containing phosphotransfer) domain-containing protein
MSDAVDDAFRALQVEYLASLPGRLQELRSDIAGLRSGKPDAGPALKVRLHRLAGSGGSYGFVRLSALAREAERWLAAHAGSGDVDPLDALLDQLTLAASDAEREVKRRVSG